MQQSVMDPVYSFIFFFMVSFTVAFVDQPLKGRASIAAAADETVLGVKTKLATELSLQPESLLATYHGMPLKDELKVGDISSDLSDGSVVYVFRRPLKKQEDQQSKKKVSSDDLDSTLTSVYSAWSDPAQRATFFRILERSDTLETLILSTPGLRDDFFALSLLRDKLLLQQYLAPKQAKRTARDHPTLIEALQGVTAMLHSEVARMTREDMLKAAGVTAASSGGPFFQEPEEEDGEEGEAGPAMPGFGRGAGLAGQQITPNQLAQALAAAGAAMRPQQAAASAQPIPAAVAAQQGQQPISATAVQQAIMAAMGGGAPAPSAAAASNQSTTPTPAQMQQLRDMGFVDDAENRAALQATGNNVETALEWIIAQREARENMQLD